MSFNPEMFDGMTEEEIESFEEEVFIEYLRQLQEQEEKNGMIRVPNLKRMHEMEASVKMLERIARQYNIKVKVEFGIEPMGYAGYVRMICPFGFSTVNVPEFCDATAAASNIEFVIENEHTQIGIIYDSVIRSERLRR